MDNIVIWKAQRPFQLSYEVKICHNNPKILAIFFFYHSKVNVGFSNKWKADAHEIPHVLIKIHVSF